jgi:hypothetical protein
MNSNEKAPVAGGQERHETFFCIQSSIPSLRGSVTARAENTPRSVNLGSATVPASEATNRIQDHQDLGFGFPGWVMEGTAGNFTTLYSSCLEVPQPFLFMGFLACMGLVLADCLTLDSEIHPQPRLNILLLGESADDRKSTAITKVVEFFRAWLNTFPCCLGIGSAEGLQKVLQKNGKLLLCFDEFKQFVGKCKIQGSVLLPCVTSLFESNAFESQTKTKEFKIEGAHLSILAASTIQTYENTWDSEFTDIGFNNRLFIVPGKGKRKFSIPQSISNEGKRQIQAGLDDIKDLVRKNAQLKVTAEAMKTFDSWYMNRELSIHSKRLDVYALRLMPLLAVNELKTEVDEKIVRKVIALCDWQLSVRKLFDPIDADNMMAKMEENIRRKLKSGDLSDRDLKRLTNAHRVGLWAYENAMKNLRKSREIAVKDNKWTYVNVKEETK